MSLKDWIVAQSQDTPIREIKYLISKKRLRGCMVYLQGQQITKQYLQWCSHLVLCKGVLYRQVILSKEDRNSLQVEIPQSYQEKGLQGCHDNVEHLGSE